jgi:ribulose-phosphate 3-epimerase
MGKLSASILSADLAHLADQVKLVAASADVIHIDVMDGHFVPPLTLGPVVVASLRPHTHRVLHGHLMVDAPEGLFEELVDAGMEIVSFHVEAVDDPGPVIRKARDAGLGVGLTVSPETPIDAVFPHLEDVDDVMVMSVHPGWSGQAFIPEALPKLERVRTELSRRGLTCDVEVDGGVKKDNARRCVEAGANVLVVASGIFQQPDVAAAAAELKAIVEAS